MCTFHVLIPKGIELTSIRFESIQTHSFSCFNSPWNQTSALLYTYIDELHGGFSKLLKVHNIRIHQRGVQPLNNHVFVC
jgi:hypothetical protein